MSSGKINKYVYLTGEEILSSNQRKIIEQDQFTYSPLAKVLKKTNKIVEDQDQMHIEALEEHGKQLIKSNGEKDFLELLKQK